MPFAVLSQVKKAVSHLNPREVRDAADRPVRISIVAPSPEALGRMETYFVPPHLSADRRAQAVRILERGGAGCDIEIYDSSLLRPPRAFSFDPEAPDDCVRHILKARQDLILPLARNLAPFRKQAVYRIIRTCAKENALFCLATALPDVLPGVLSIPWAAGEFGSDAAFLTMNQMRMAFFLAAASDRPVGYREQKSEIASMVAGAFGWRALARELIGKVPFGGGLIPKAAIAYAGTFAVGVSLERLYRLGYGFTREERRAAYDDAYVYGRQIAGMLLENLRKPRTQPKPAVLRRAQ
jgi:hypothetical protein